MNKTIYFLSFVALIASCSNPKDQEVTFEEKHHGLDLANMDTTVRPQDDFNRFVNGLWLDNVDMPSDQGRWSAFNELIEANNDIVLAVLNTAADNKEYAPDSDQKKAANFYAVGMDSLLAEEKKFSPLDGVFEKINAIENIADLQEYLAYQSTIGGNAFMNFYVSPNLANSKMNAAYISQSGLGLPDSDYYLKEDEKSVEIQNKYIAHIAKMLMLLGNNEDDANAKANAIFGLEYELAEISMNSTELRDIQAQNNPMAMAEVYELSPAIDWNKYLADLGVSNVDTMIVDQPEFIAGVSNILSDSDVQLWKDYLTWNILNNYASLLHHEVVATDFDFYGTVLRGTPQNRPRWKRVLSNSNAALGEAIGKLYVDAVFPPEAKTAANEMVEDVLAALEVRINNVDWMTAETKEKAIDKLHAVTVKIGYPDKWKDYSALEVKRNSDDASYAGNFMAAAIWGHNEEMAKLHKPVDEMEWHMNPQTVNAYYNPLANEMVFPAAILQPPFFDFEADPAVNFGGIGCVIGHEISHGFDDMGAQFDKDGNFNNWWTEEDLAAFQDRGKSLVDQFNGYEPLDSLFINGQLTLGENIGDLGGINAAFDGLQIYLSTHEVPEFIDGYTQDERFFMSWATIWRTKFRDEELRSRILTDSHSPGNYRAFAPLRNIDVFYTTFNVQEGDGMYLPVEERVIIW
jgi:putative endopeptidase